MKQLYKKTLFIFRRDLRLADNTGLIQALEQSQQVMPLFIADPRQISTDNDYRSMNALEFMQESLADLAQQLKKYKSTLFIADGIAEDILEKIIKKESIDAIFLNTDYTPFSMKRDEAVHKICVHNKIPLHSFHDALLNNPEIIKTKNQTPYTVFTPFFKACLRVSIPAEQKFPKTAAFVKTTKLKYHDTSFFKKLIARKNRNRADHGGTEHALQLLKNLKKLKNYEREHDLPSIATSHLSAHHKFGTVSIRQSYHAIQKYLSADHPLIRQLYWRDFFYYVAYHSPFVFGHAYHEKYDKLSWSKSAKLFEAWRQGNTGFPIVDAGMRELNATGFMHNRCRLITASFLVKDLHINWLWGEKYFAQKLTDYDPCVNNGNWQWVASTGCDAQPYFRIFNPWLQQKKFDPDCEYIKQWVPELKKIKPSIIHTWFKNSSPEIVGYPRPIVDHAVESVVAKRMYRRK